MINFSKYLLLIYFLLKPFYIFSSGVLQPADIFLLASAILFLVSARLDTRVGKNLKNIMRDNRLLTLFITCTFLINGVYFLLIPEFKFLLSSIYFVFNLLAIIVFSAFCTDHIFLRRVSSVFKFSLILQLVFWATSIGRYYSPDRYMGTFNDPNQFGFYIFISLLFLFVIEIILKTSKKNLLYWLIGILLVILSASTGMILGLAVFAVLYLLYILKTFHPTASRVRKLVLGLASFVAILFISTGIYVYAPSDSLRPQGSQNPDSQNFAIIERVGSKFSKAGGEDDISLWEDRGYDILYKYPLYILFGAGEGGYSRYTAAANNHGNEVHATLPSMLFYYGIIPFLIFLGWLYSRIKDIDPRAKIAFAALLVESFTLLNQRQALFWMVIVLAAIATPLINVKKLTKQAISKGVAA